MVEVLYSVAHIAKFFLPPVLVVTLLYMIWKVFTHGTRAERDKNIRNIGYWFLVGVVVLVLLHVVTLTFSHTEPVLL